LVSAVFSFLSCRFRPHCFLLLPYTSLFRSCPPGNPARHGPAHSGPFHRPHPLRKDPCGSHPTVTPSVSRPSLLASALTGETLGRSEEHTSELQSRENLVCRLLLETKNISRQ